MSQDKLHLWNEEVVVRGWWDLQVSLMESILLSECIHFTFQITSMLILMCLNWMTKTNWHVFWRALGTTATSVIRSEDKQTRVLEFYQFEIRHETSQKLIEQFSTLTLAGFKFRFWSSKLFKALKTNQQIDSKPHQSFWQETFFYKPFFSKALCQWICKQNSIHQRCVIVVS